MTTSTTDTFCLTDGATIYYPQGAGRVRAIGLEHLADADSDHARDVYTVAVTLGEMLQNREMLAPVRDSDPPAMWTHGIGGPLGFPEDFADALADWLDWCDAEEQAADEAGMLAVVSEAA
jgi:hypothetical protein